MKITTRILTGFLLTIILGCNPSDQKEQFKCTLLAYEPPSIPCGVLSVWQGMKFKETDNSREFIILLHCPEQYENSFFEPGKRYLVQVDRKKKLNPGSELVLNKYKNENLAVYIAVSIEKE